ncbi:hypothetical protein T265_04934 [Opisthorchis viverrini]|uniref:Uncharacterized protein n=1 Tax=Opisthorchis viverrini TaxID=6198 RepID=A0A074ZY10_OPIVI|nr:hypothetical protein T265_04934 [Opisthorchis viverrini]KER28175.1 hypothetical protein T265_04934 [Opisthorchis viverrini]
MYPNSKYGGAIEPTISYHSQWWLRLVNTVLEKDNFSTNSNSVNITFYTDDVAGYVNPVEETF